MPRAFVLLCAVVLLVTGCSGAGGEEASTNALLTPVAEPERIDEFAVGRPLNRAGIGDVERVFARYETSRSALIELYQRQPWFQDGLTRDEELFVERGISFVAKYDGPRSARISEQTIAQKLYRYEKLQLSQGEVELLLIYEPGQQGDREMTLIKLIIPALESLVGVPYPEKVMTFVNGDFDINDFNEGEFIRMDRCCVTNPFILAHELAHTYWSVAASWFNEGMADLYAIMVLEALNQQMPSGWSRQSAELDSYYAGRKREASRYPFKILPQRLASEGLYQAADAFLYELRDIVGPDDFRAAVRRVYLTSDYSRVNVSDFRVAEIFLQFADEGGRARIKQMFNESVWGDNGQRYERLKELEQTP